MTTWSRKTQRITAVALLALALVFLSLIALWPHFNMNSMESKLTGIQTKLIEYEIDVKEGEQLASSNDLLERLNKKSKLLLYGTTIGIAGANLQELVLSRITRNGGVVSQIQVLPTRSENELVRVPVSLNLTTDTKGLRDIIFDLETNPSLLYIRNLVVSLANQNSKVGQKNKQRQGRVVLDISIRIFGYARKASRT